MSLFFFLIVLGLVASVGVTKLPPRGLVGLLFVAVPLGGLWCAVTWC